MIRRRTTLAFLLAAAAAACGGGSGGPAGGGVQPGILTASLTVASGTPGALLLTITGGRVTSVSPVNPGAVQVSFASQIPGITRVMVTGALQTGDLLTITVPDITSFSGYAVRVDQAADNLTFALIDPAPYTLVIHK
jgi:hypothetical protein